MVPSLCGLPPIDDSKISPQLICSSKFHKYDNYDKATYRVPPIASFPRQTCSPGCSHCPAANVGPLSSGSVTNLILTTAFDTYLTPRSPRAQYQDWAPRPSRAPSGV